MTLGFGSIRALFATLALTVAVALAAPASAQQPSSVNPTASAVQEEQLLNALRDGGAISGRVSIPDARSANLVRPENRDWRAFQNGTLKWIGAIAILGMLALLTIFYLTRGRIRTEGGVSGVKLKRFNAFERFAHWLTATSFVVLALTGLNITFGKYIVLPLLGPGAFTTLSQAGKFAHNYLAWPFILGLVFMLVVWIKDNVPSRLDIAWLKAGGGFFSDHHPPAKRFNAGQKGIFWSVILGGAAIAASGLVMLFPFTVTDIAGMQSAQIVHGVAGVVLTGIIIAHIYIGSLGMEGAYDAMGSGEVDLNWAKAHHSLWAEEELAKKAGGRPSAVEGKVPPSAVPAE